MNRRNSCQEWDVSDGPLDSDGTGKMLVVSRYLIFLSLGAALLAQSPSLSIAPPVITECVAGRGSARLLWNSLGPGSVQVRIGDAQGPAMTGREAPAGSAQTGGWVSNGLVFVLVADAGAELARVTAKVICDATPDPLEGALAAGAWFPLQVGNQWVYRSDSRFPTSAYTTWTITGVEQRKDRTYFVLSSIPGQGRATTCCCEAMARGGSTAYGTQRLKPRNCSWIQRRLPILPPC